MKKKRKKKVPWPQAPRWGLVSPWEKEIKRSEILQKYEAILLGKKKS